MGVGLKYSDNNRLWLTVYTRSFVSCPILSAFKGLSLDNCSEITIYTICGQFQDLEKLPLKLKCPDFQG